MKIVKTVLPIYKVILEHPDYGSTQNTFCITQTEEELPSPFAQGEEWEHFYKNLVKETWNCFNKSGFWHTMTIIEQTMIDGCLYDTMICENIGFANL